MFLGFTPFSFGNGGYVGKICGDIPNGGSTSLVCSLSTEECVDLETRYRIFCCLIGEKLDGSEIREKCREFGIEKRYSSPYHGEAERII